LVVVAAAAAAAAGSGWRVRIVEAAGIRSSAGLRFSSVLPARARADVFPSTRADR
jgi:hypothetical protein